MTTIVYDHKNKQIAIDSRATSSGIIVDDDDCYTGGKVHVYDIESAKFIE